MVNNHRRGIIRLPKGWKVSDVIQETKPKIQSTETKNIFEVDDKVLIKDTAKLVKIRGATGLVVEVKDESVRILVNGERRWLSIRNLELIKDGY